MVSIFFRPVRILQSIVSLTTAVRFATKLALGIRKLAPEGHIEIPVATEGHLRICDGVSGAVSSAEDTGANQIASIIWIDDRAWEFRWTVGMIT